MQHRFDLPTIDPLRILIVDDSPADYALILDLLAQEAMRNADVQWSHAFDDALARIAQETFDILLIDYRLDSHTGADLLQAARELGVTTPALVLTGFASQAVEVAAERSGADGFIPKQDLTGALLHRSIRYAVIQARAANAVRAIGELGYSILDSLPAHIAVVDADTTILAVNRAWRTRCDGEGLTLTDHGVGALYADVSCSMHLAADHDVQIVNDGLREVLAGTSTTVTHAYPCRLRDGDRWFCVTINPLHGVQIGRAVVIHEDITARTLAEAARQDAETQYQILIEQVPAVIFTEDLHGIITYMCPQVVTLSGFSVDAWIGTRTFWLSVTHDDDRDMVEAAQVAAATSGQSFEIEYRWVVKDGTVVWVRHQTQLIPDANGYPQFWQGFITDITQQKLAQHDLLARESRFTALMQHAVDLVAIVDEHGAITYESPAVTRVLGYAPEETIQTSFWERLHPDQLNTARALMAEVLESPGQSLPAEYQLRHRDGGWRRFEATLINLIDVPSVHGIVINARDVTDRVAGEHALRESERRLRDVVENIPAVTYTYTLGDDQHPATTVFSAQVSDVVGLKPETLRTWDRWFAMMHPGDRQRVRDESDRTNASGEPFDVTYRVRSATDAWHWVHDVAVRTRHDADAHDVWQGFFFDITEQKRAEIAIRESESRYATLIRHLPNGAILLFDHDLRFQVADGAALEATGIRGADVVGKTLEEAVSPGAFLVLEPGYRAALQGTARQFEMRSGAMDYLVNIVPVRGIDDEIIAGMAMAVDITDRKELERQVTHLALHDSLTGLPNRVLLTDRLEQTLLNANRRNATVAVFFVDIDDFKSVNDTLGHESGDVVLRQIAQRIQSNLRGEDVVARMGGDEFVIVLGDAHGAVEALEVATRIITSIEHPFGAHGREIHLSCSIGIALSGADGVTPSDLLRHADIALYRVKASGKHGIDLFDEEMYTSAMQRLELERDLRGAVSRAEFFLVYQPIVCIASGHVDAVEALIRWQHPVRGLVGPADFIPLAESTGLIVEIGDWVIREACRQLAAWRAAGTCSGDLRVNVNLAARQFRDAGLVGRVASALSSVGLPPDRLSLEITESDVMADAAVAATRLHELKDLGVGIVIDDFGTGYSSLAYLHEFPADVLKIDRSFVSRIGSAANVLPVVSATIALAHTLGLQVVGEGIETQEQLTVLQGLGCEKAQGFYFSRPVSVWQMTWSDGRLLPIP